MSSIKTILVTGGLGYIGSHTVVELFNKQYLKENKVKNEYDVVIVDDCSTCSEKVLSILENMVGKKIPFYKVSIVNKNVLEETFKRHKFYAVIHFAGKKAVGESVEKPLYYYENNFVGTLNLIELCLKYKINNFIFSSSCTVYGNRDDKPKEDEKLLFPINPYGRSKLFVEYMLKDIAKVEKDFKIALLRYCNPVAAHPSGKIGEDPFLKPINLFPVIQNLVRGTLKEMKIFGKDYPTKDGTCIRDYIHVYDLATAHILALKKMLETKQSKKINLGIGKGFTVLEIIKIAEFIVNDKIKYEITNRRDGDPECVICDNNLAKTYLNWNIKYSAVKEHIKHTWNWLNK